MIKYDDFAKLPIFKKGWIALDLKNNSVYFYGTKPKWYKDYGTWRGNGSCTIINTNFWLVDCTGIKPEDSLRKVGGKSKISHCMSTDLSIGDKVYIICYDTCYYVHDRAFPITDICFEYYPKDKTEEVKLDLYYKGGESINVYRLRYGRENVYKTKKEAQKECDRRNAELKRKEQK